MLLFFRDRPLPPDQQPKTSSQKTAQAQGFAGMLTRVFPGAARSLYGNVRGAGVPKNHDI